MKSHFSNLLETFLLCSFSIILSVGLSSEKFSFSLHSPSICFAVLQRFFFISSSSTIARRLHVGGMTQSKMKMLWRREMMSRRDSRSDNVMSPKPTEYWMRKTSKHLELNVCIFRVLRVDQMRVLKLLRWRECEHSRHSKQAAETEGKGMKLEKGKRSENVYNLNCVETAMEWKTLLKMISRASETSMKSLNMKLFFIFSRPSYFLELLFSPQQFSLVFHFWCGKWDSVSDLGWLFCVLRTLLYVRTK